MDQIYTEESLKKLETILQKRKDRKKIPDGVYFQEKLSDEEHEKICEKLIFPNLDKHEETKDTKHTS